MLQLLDHPGSFSLEAGPEATRLLSAVSMQMAAFLAPIVGADCAVGACGGVPSADAESSPSSKSARNGRACRRSPVGSASSAARARSNSGKSLFKFAAIGLVCVIAEAQRDKVANALAVDPASLPEVILSLVVQLVSAVCTTIVLMVVGDIVWSRLRWRTDLRMTRQEVKDEMKQSEGDPLVKSRLRSLARDRARRRMIAAVPSATMVIANPTHFAVALKYDRGKGGAPLVVAKGADLIAQRIREVASQHAVPIIEDKPLARALYDAVEVGQWIPPEFYRAIAQILHLLYQRSSHARA